MLYNMIATEIKCIITFLTYFYLITSFINNLLTTIYIKKNIQNVSVQFYEFSQSENITQIKNKNITSNSEAPPTPPTYALSHTDSISKVIRGLNS